MPADNPMKNARDRKYVALDEIYEVQYWMKAFHATAEELRDAVAAVGHSAEQVGKHLKAKEMNMMQRHV